MIEELIEKVKYRAEGLGFEKKSFGYLKRNEGPTKTWFFIELYNIDYEPIEYGINERFHYLTLGLL